MELTIPESLEAEHEELHQQLYKGIKMGGKVGEAGLMGVAATIKTVLVIYHKMTTLK